MKNFNASYTGLRYDLLKHIRTPNNIILDVGCATGENGAYLNEKGFAERIYGIELNEKMAAKASEKLHKVYIGDLNYPEFRNRLTQELPLFDYILFGDVLEHLIHPQKVLKELTKNLKPGGSVIISVPNIGHLELFIQVYINGTWPLNSRGIFDRTHLRWFTRKDIFDLIEKCDLKVVKYERKLRARDSLNSSFNWRYKLVRMINKDWVTFQHILIGVSEK